MLGFSVPKDNFGEWHARMGDRKPLVEGLGCIKVGPRFVLNPVLPDTARPAATYFTCLCMLTCLPQLFGGFKGCMEGRSLTVGLAGGSFASLLGQALSTAFDAPVHFALSAECPICPGFEVDLGALDFRSVLIGILVGILAGPLLDILSLLRYSWRTWVRNRIASLARRSTTLYRVL